jgi:hypothetical protein
LRGDRCETSPGLPRRQFPELMIAEENLVEMLARKP